MRTGKQSPIHNFVVLILLGIYRISYGLYVKLYYRLRSHNKSVIPKKGSYLLLANHCNNFDGLFLQCLINKPIHYVVTDAVFKNKTLGKLLLFVGYIPKRKLVTDSVAIRQIIRTIKQGGIVGIFPEGGRNWDGKTGDISPATYRLIRLLHVPVVTARIQGSYLSEPRWAETKRRGVVEIDFKVHFLDGRFPDRDLIGCEIESSLNHNEAIWQNEKRILFKGNALSKGLDRLLYACPSCQQIGTMNSTNDRITCLSCGAEYRLDTYGFLHSINGLLPANNIPELNEWQKKLLASHLQNANADTILLSDDGAGLFCSKAQHSPFEMDEEGSLQLTCDNLIIGHRSFEISQIHGISVYFKTHLEFRFDGLDYRIGFSENRVSAYKWNCALETIKKMKREI